MEQPPEKEKAQRASAHSVRRGNRPDGRRLASRALSPACHCMCPELWCVVGLLLVFTPPSGHEDGAPRLSVIARPAGYLYQSGSENRAFIAYFLRRTSWCPALDGTGGNDMFFTKYEDHGACRRGIVVTHSMLRVLTTRSTRDQTT
jgi:hypothetical protein